MNAKELEVAGIEFTVTALDAGFFPITAAEIPEYMADPIGWYARQYGVSRERVEVWQRFVDSDYRCAATTRRGTRCTLPAEEYYRLSVCDFDPAWDGFCRRHQPKVGQVGADQAA